MNKTTINGIDCSWFEDCIYFKQLKRLEQREKALTELADDLQKRNHDLTLTNERLEQENKELKKRQITKNGFICDCEQNAKYKQALEEIRELIQKCEIEDISCVQCKERKRCHCDLTRLLVEKIDEVLKNE